MPPLRDPITAGESARLPTDVVSLDRSSLRLDEKTAFRPGYADSEDASESAALDPALGKLVEEMTRKIQAGEAVDLEVLAGEHSEWAGTLRQIMRALRGLAELGHAVGGGAQGTDPQLAEPAVRPVFGDFRIVREIGRGGMGIVYEAEQLALARPVALKILTSAAALDSRALERFKLEAQVAGWLRHPRIVPVYAVGACNDVPFYAMQLIAGGSLADLIAELRAISVDRARGTTGGLSALAGGLLSGRFAPDRHKLEIGSRHEKSTSDAGSVLPPGASIRARGYLRTVARLGIQAAEALGYAHDQGIIHRDIKPANLLLDDHGDLWVADFGMADVQGGPRLTLTGDLPGTLRYMSPEQASGTRALVDRRTDIYSLGATLYELLTLESAITGDSRPEIFRQIAEDEPAPIWRLNPAVPVDLGVIVGKAISKEPSNRYETAWHLAADLERFLDGLPIAARRVGPLNKSWRWARRKPLLACLAASLALALLAGLAGIMWNWREAVRQKGLLLVAEREARMQAGKADAINRFLINKLLNQASPENNPAANRVTLLEVLDRAAAEVGSSFSDQPAIEAAIRLAIGKTYHGLGEHAKSASHLEAAYRILDRETVDPSRFEAMATLGHNLTHLGRLDEAEPLLKNGYEQSTRILGPGHAVSLSAAEYLADLCSARGRDAEAEQIYRRYLAEACRARHPDQEIVLTAVNNLGLTLLRLGKIDEAEVLYRQLAQDSRRIRGTKHPGTLSVINNLAILLEKRKKYADAEHLFRECQKLNLEVLGPQHPGSLASGFNLACVIKDQGRLDEAETLFRENLSAQRQILGPEHPSTLYAQSGLGALLIQRGKLDEAEGLLRRCQEAQRRALGPDHRDTSITARRYASIMAARAGGGANKSSRLAGLPDR